MNINKHNNNIVTVQQWLTCTSPSQRSRHAIDKQHSHAFKPNGPIEVHSWDDIQEKMNYIKSAFVMLVVKAIWCGHCRDFTPWVENLAKHYANVQVLILETKKDRANREPGFDDCCQKLQCTSFPSLYLWTNKGKVYKLKRKPLNYKDVDKIQQIWIGDASSWFEAEIERTKKDQVYQNMSSCLDNFQVSDITLVENWPS